MFDNDIVYLDRIFSVMVYFGLAFIILMLAVWAYSYVRYGEKKAARSYRNGGERNW